MTEAGNEKIHVMYVMYALFWILFGISDHFYPTLHHVKSRFGHLTDSLPPRRHNYCHKIH